MNPFFFFTFQQALQGKINAHFKIWVKFSLQVLLENEQPSPLGEEHYAEAPEGTRQLISL